MRASTVPRDLVVEGVELAKSRLQAGEAVPPMILLERWGDSSVEQFAQDALPAARMRFAELLRSATGNDRCALVHVGFVGRSERGIFVELARAGQSQADVFVQRFRPHRGRFRRFKLIGDFTPEREGRLIL